MMTPFAHQGRDEAARTRHGGSILSQAAAVVRCAAVCASLLAAWWAFGASRELAGPCSARAEEPSADRAGSAGKALPGKTSAGKAAARKPNIVLILMDDMGWRDVGFMGNTFVETPNLDRLAKQGVVFTQAYASAPNCAPTRACLMSGQYTPRHGIYTVVDPRQPAGSPWHKMLGAESQSELATEVVTVAEALRDGGYATAFLGMWNLGRGRTGPRTPGGQGFDTVVFPENIGFAKDAYQDDRGNYLSDRLADEVLKFIEQHRERPFFVYLADHAVHAPYDPKPELLAKYEQKLRGPRAAADANTQERAPQRSQKTTPQRAEPSSPTQERAEGRSQSEEQPQQQQQQQQQQQGQGQGQGQPSGQRSGPGESQEPGEEQGPGRRQGQGQVLGQGQGQGRRGGRGGGGSGAVDDPAYAATIEAVDRNVGRILEALKTWKLEENTLVVFTSDNGGTQQYTAPLNGGKGQLYEGGIRVPLAVRGPGIGKPGTKCEVPVASVDFYPTFLELAGLKPPARQSLDGASLGPLLAGSSTLNRARMFWHFPCYVGRSPPSSAMREGDFKLIEFFEDGGRVELYNLRTDPGERDNLATAMREKATAMLTTLRAWQKDTGALNPPGPNPAYNPNAERNPMGRPMGGQKGGPMGGQKGGPMGGKRGGPMGGQKGGPMGAKQGS